ncbi:MAG: HTTM domain-containing protein [Polyangiaceae bacterium]
MSLGASLAVRVWRPWVALWDRREPATSMALTRIFVGSVLFLDMLLGVYRGAMPPLIAPPPRGFGVLAPAWPDIIPAPMGGEDVAWFWWGLVVVSSFLFAVGAFHRVAGTILSLGLINFARFDPDGDAIDTLYRIVVPLLTLSQANARLSVDAWMARISEKPLPAFVPAWPRYLLMLQLLWMYFSAGHCRDDAAWWPWGGFTAIGHVMGDPHFARFAPGSLRAFYPLTRIGTAVSMTFELSAPLMIFFTAFRDRGGGAFGAFARQVRARWLWLGAGVLLHIGIAITMTLGMFPYGVLALYALFLHPDEWEAIFRRVLRREAVAPSAAGRLPLEVR